MYAVVQIGGSQYKIAEGDVIRTNRLKDDEGSQITLDQVLLFANGSEVRVGQPFLEDVKVTAKIQSHLAGSKVLAFKFRRRKDSSTLRGHRQKLTVLNITKIAG